MAINKNNVSDNKKKNSQSVASPGIEAFLPTSAKEVANLGWDHIDVILFSGDAYVDHPAFGTAIIARVLEAEGLNVAVVSQPNWRDDLRDFKKLGEPRLFFAVGAGSMDSMVNHYTAGKRRRKDDAYTPDGKAGQRPDDASIVYCNILKDLYPDVPVVLGGVEASLRRCVHYDYWQDEVRPSILEESKADLLTYGMSEESMQEIVRLMQRGVPMTSLTNIPQTAYLAEKVPTHKQWEDVKLHSFAKNKEDKRIFAQDFKTIEESGNAYLKKRLLQSHGHRTLVVNPGNAPMSTKALDAIAELPYTRLPHPRYQGKRIPAFDMIKHSVTTHRGCFGGCAFCAIYSHQGKFISSRSKESILKEVDQITVKGDFKGTISDLGGPSANMYKMAGADIDQCKVCRRASCVYPRICRNLNTDHHPITDIYKTASAKEEVKHCYVGSGIRYDMLIDEKGNALSRDKGQYMTQMITEHTSGRLTVAPEHTSDDVLKLMRKPSYRYFDAFEKVFRRTVEKAGKKFQLVPYFISGHPGSESEDMAELAVKAKSQNLYLEQVQDFTPTPMTLATTMYYTGINPNNGESVYVARSREEKVNQKRFFFWYKREEQEGIRNELKRIGRGDLVDDLFKRKLKAGEEEREKPSSRHSKSRGADRKDKTDFKSAGRKGKSRSSGRNDKSDFKGKGRRDDADFKSAGRGEKPAYKGGRDESESRGSGRKGKSDFRPSNRNDKPGFKSAGRGDDSGFKGSGRRGKPDYNGASKKRSKPPRRGRG